MNTLMNEFKFDKLAVCGSARAGRLTTPHGVIETPVFMPVGTQGSVKALTGDDLTEIGAQIILGNTYHLYLRPGIKVIEHFGGLHKMIKWDRPMLTDSGGFQVSSLGLFNRKRPGHVKLNLIDEEGVTFYSHLDGSEHRLTPEISMQIQGVLGADIVMAFDEATPDIGREYAKKAMERTHAWLKRSIAEWRRIQQMRDERKIPQQALFGIIQGGNYQDLRRESVEVVLSHKLFGVAIGGETIGRSALETEENMSWIRDQIPEDIPRYTMGVGIGLAEVVDAIKSGADMFDCVAPTKMARTGLLYTGRLSVTAEDVMTARIVSDYHRARINIGNSEFVDDTEPIDTACDCYTCRRGYSRSYLRHLFMAKELTFYRLATIHNLRMVIRLVQGLRQLIINSDRVVE